MDNDPPKRYPMFSLSRMGRQGPKTMIRSSVICHLPKNHRRLFAHRRLLQEAKNRHQDPVRAQHIPEIVAVSGDIAERPERLLLKHGVRSRKEANELRRRREY